MSRTKITDSAGYVFNRNGRWYLQVRIDAARIMRVIRDDQGTAVTRKEDAVKWRPATLAAIRAERAGASVERVPLADVESVYVASLATYRKTKGNKHADATADVAIAQRTLAASRCYLGAFIAFLQSEFPAVKGLADINAVAAERFMATRAGLKDGSYNRVLAALRHVFNVIPHTRANNPFARVQRRPKRDVDAETAHKERFTPEQLAVIQAKARGWIRPAVFVAYHTGMRLSDVCTLQWSDVDAAAGFITYTSRKSNRRVEVYCPAVMPYLAEWRAAAAVDWSEFDPNDRRFLAGALGVSVGKVQALVKAGEGIGADTPDGIALAVQGMRRRLIEQQATRQGHGRALAVREPDAPLRLPLRPVPEGLDGYVFPRQADAYLGIAREKRDPTQPAKEFQRFLRDVCGLETANDKCEQVLGFHSFRVTFVSTHRVAGEDFEAIREKVGHADAKTTAGYDRRTIEERRAEMVKRYLPMPEIGAAADPAEETRATLRKLIDTMDATALARLAADMKVSE